MNLNQVIVLNEGYSFMENLPDLHGRTMDNDTDRAVPSATMMANCTCTLIKSPDCNVIVDTMTPWDGDLLLQKLQEHGLTPDDIDWVVSTHGHSDHLGNNNLFLKARHMVGTSISQRNRYFIHDFNNAPYSLSSGIEVIASPGHTLSCVSVLVHRGSILLTEPKQQQPEQPEPEPTGTIAIVGDLFERREDIEQPALWMEAGSEDPAAQRKNRARVASLADVIVPGHGGPFPVNQMMRDTLQHQVAAGFGECSAEEDGRKEN
ncbi:metallo-beta-lactamase domain-containing protein 1 [Uranotaenia lowii]|uniref:metallo-beta-lactamase domain-containing protein 1 n=1 Tax=Uranotaenia lowii TaxID=190385 RepID=UPI00247AACAE|nr:metallo-beta-lactamase domain-containing protein 1 [Uranotaenia lowii]